MKKYKEWLPVAGMAVLLLVLSIALFFSVRDQPDPRREPEATTVKKEDKDENTTQRKRKKTGRSDDKDCIEVYGTGYLYYLDPEDDQVFQRRLTRFLQDKGIKAETATVVEYHIDERKEEEEPAQFFLEIHDKKHTIVRALFKKTTGTYRFDLPNQSLPPQGLTGLICQISPCRMTSKRSVMKRNRRFLKARRMSQFQRADCPSQIRKGSLRKQLT